MRIKAGRIWLTTWKTCSRTSEKNIKLFLVKYLASDGTRPHGFVQVLSRHRCAHATPKVALAVMVVALLTLPRSVAGPRAPVAWATPSPVRAPSPHPGR